MGEMNAAFQGADHIRQIIFQVGAVGTGTEGNAVVRVIYHLHHTQDVLLVDDDTGQPEDTPGGIVGVDRHVNVVFVTGGHDTLQKIFQVGKKLFVIHIFVHFEQFFDMSHTLRLPAGHYSAVHIAGNGVEHFGRINSVYSSLIVSKDCRTVGTHSGKFGSCPVKDRHEIVAYHMDACLTEPFQGSDIILYILFTVGRTDLDGIVNVDTLDTGQL